VYAVDQIYIPL